MPFRSAQTLVFSRHEREIIAFNFLTNSAFVCGQDVMGLLTSVNEWTEFEDLPPLFPGLASDELRANIDALIAVDALVQQGTTLADEEQAFAETWRWGMPAALFHFTVQDRSHMSLEEIEDLQRDRIAELPQPPLHLTNESFGGNIVRLPSALHDNDLLTLMARRRTVRSATHAAVTLQQLSDCLFAGMGIVGQTENCIGTLPLKMTPSGGARNPYEAYVYVQSVEGLEPGFYHYSASEPSLARVTEELPKLSELMGGQPWTDGMPCAIFLCAFLERSMWKYDDANAYRVVLIEAGHIGQNIMLAATQHDLSACPTAALNHSAIQKAVGISNRATQWPIYALTLSHPDRQSSTAFIAA